MFVKQSTPDTKEENVARTRCMHWLNRYLLLNSISNQIIATKQLDLLNK